jgi:hypothetical protein
MAHEQIIRQARPRDHLPFRFGIGEADGVHVAQASVEGRMVLEQQ